MPSDRSPLEDLHSALAISQSMLNMAQSGDWDGLIAKEKERQALIGALRMRAQAAELLPSESPDREEALRIMADIIDADQKTQAIAQSWMNKISKDLGEIDLAKRVDAAYGAR